MDYIVRTVLVGDVGVGKSRLLHNICQIPYTEGTTIGVDIASRIIRHGHRLFKMMLYDLSGDGRFDAITATFMKDVACVLVIYNVCDRRSYEKAAQWLQSIRTNMRDNELLYIILLGNQTDRVDDRVITWYEGYQLSLTFNTKFLEVSALNPADHILLSITGHVTDHLQQGTLDTTQKKYGVRSYSGLDLESPTRDSQCCSVT